MTLFSTSETLSAICLLGLLPFVWFILCTALVHSFDTQSVRLSLVKSGILSGLWCVIGTETLSAGRLFVPLPVALWWAVPSLLMAMLVYQRRHLLKRPSVEPESSLDWGLVAGLAFILAVTGVIALVTPPNNYDSQEYHLPRQFFWVQQGHVGTFAANDERQLAMPPFSEFVGANLMVLSGSDYWANMVQWLALGLTAAVVSLIAKVLGCGTRGQSFAALFTVTNPTAALQAINTKNDVVTALFVCSAALFCAQIIREKRCDWGRAFLLGSAIGLAMFTKGTGMLFVIPISLFAGIALLWIHWREGILLGAAISTITLAINTPHFLRNHAEFKSIFNRPQSKGGYDLRNEIHTPAAFVSNVSRNIAMHLTFSSKSDYVISNAVAGLHSAIDLGINDKRTTHASQFEVANPYKNSEDQSRAPLHMVLALVTLVLLLRPGKHLPVAVRLFCAIPFLAFLLFCFEVKWQIWHNRLQIPLFCLLAPATAVVLTRYKAITYLVAIGLFFFTTPLVLRNQSKAIAGRNRIFKKTSDEIRFDARPYMLPALEWMQSVTKDLNVKSVAIHAQPHSWVYPVARKLSQLPNQPTVFILTPTFGKSFAVTNLEPALIVAVDQNVAQKTIAPVLRSRAGHPFHYFGEYANIRLYVPQADQESISHLLPPFSGWTSTNGIGPIENAFARVPDVPIRKSVGTETKLAFKADQPDRTLLLEAKADASASEQEIMIALNGTPIHSDVLSPSEYRKITVSLSAIKGTNELILRYPQKNNETPSPVSYRSLQIKM